MTTDRNDPLLKEKREDGQQKAHITLSEEERAKGFVRPVRHSYVHSGAGPFCGKPIKKSYGSVSRCTGAPDHEGDCPSSMDSLLFDLHEKGCGTVTKMGSSIAETYARQPDFYGTTFCCGCQKYPAVGEYGEFTWEGTDEKVGT